MPTVVTHQRPPRVPTTISGTTRTPPAGDPAEKAKDPNATGPVPGSPTSSRTTACRVSSAQARPASANRCGAGRVDADGAAPADQALAAPDPGERSRLREERQQRPGVRAAGRSGPPGAGGPRSGQLAVDIDLSVGGAVGGRVPGGCDDGHMPRASLDKRPQEVAAMFDEVAARYDRTNDVLSLWQDRRWRRAVVEALDLRPGERLLDLAAGTGTSTEPFADAGVLAVPCDFSHRDAPGGQAPPPRPAVRGGRRRQPAVRGRRLRRGDHLVRAAQRGRPGGRARRAAQGHPARRPARDLRVLPPDLGAVGGASTPAT